MLNFFRKSKNQEIFSPVSGEYVLLDDVPDKVFSRKMMGDGFAIIPNSGRIVSPINGEVIMIPSSKHAIGIQSDDGLELLIHIGLDTVKMQGEGFKSIVKVGDRVSVGDYLVEADLDKISIENYNPITMIILTSNLNYKLTKQVENGKVDSLQSIIKLETV